VYQNFPSPPLRDRDRRLLLPSPAKKNDCASHLTPAHWSGQVSADAVVFIVDDDASVAQALARLLRVEGFITQAFSSAREFLASHDASVPGCVIADLSMVGMDGLELQHALLARGCRRPIVFMTAWDDVQMRHEAMLAGAIGVLRKPANRSALLASVREAIERDDVSRSKQTQLLAPNFS
jgi:FixJ family two-component response regulator